jgi:hypothetical protein
MEGVEEGPFKQTSGFSVATAEARNLRDLRNRKYGQPVYVSSDHPLARKGQTATWEKFNVRLAVVKFKDGTVLGYDPADLLLPTRFEDGQPVFESRTCEVCRATFPLTQQEVQQKKDLARCPLCQES